MSGHSKWASIKHKKGAADAKRGKLFTKLIKEITIAAKLGGGDLNANPRLRLAVDTAKASSMPKDNIDRGIKKGTGELEGVSYEEYSYEGYGPGGAAVLINTLTDNKNRTISEIRHTFVKYNGNMGENGCVAWMFTKCGFFSIDASKIDEERLMEIVLEAGAEDIKEVDGEFEITTELACFEAVKKALEEAAIETNLAEITMIPQSTVKLEGKQAEQMLKLMEAFEDHDDVQDVYSNFDISDEVMESLE
ncbi:MAG: YebC/PmpR family DNA-binding transcriptional regulator [Pseudomonadota bacterium]